MCEPEVTAVEVNQRDLVDKVLARYPEEFTVFRELLQNADDAGAKNFNIVFESPRGRASNGTTPGLNSAKVFKWVVKNDGVQFEPADWKRLTKIAEGNPDERKIGAFGLFVKKEECDCDKWTVIEMELKQESTIPRIFELTRFLVTSVTFLTRVEHVEIFLDDTKLSHLTKTRKKASQSIAISQHMNRKSRDGTMTIDSVELMSQEVNVIFFGDTLIGGPKTLAARAEPEEGGNPAKFKNFFSMEKTPKSNGITAAPKIAAAASETSSSESSVQFSAKCSIYSAKVTVSAKPNLEKGLESATKKKLPKDFPFEMVFFSKDEHDKQSQEEAGFGSVFRGPQGFCPQLEAPHPPRIFIGQSTAQTTGMACHMSGRFISTVERGSIDLANGHVSKWNEELLYVGGFLARIAYDSEMNKVKDAWSTPSKQNAEQLELALYAMKSFVFHPSTPDPKVSQIIKDAFYACSESDKFPFISDQGIRYTKDIRLYNHQFAHFMRTPVFPTELRPILTSMTLPKHLQIGPYTFRDVVKELDSRWLSESEMTACLRWWSTSLGSRSPLDEQQKRCRDELLKVGKTHSGGKEVRLSSISKFIDGRMLNIRRPDDPLPDDTIPPALIQMTFWIPEVFGWKEMSIIHWLRHLKNSPPDRAHDISHTPSFAQHVLGVLGNLWPSLDENSRSEVREILEDMNCIPTTISNVPYMKRPKEAYFSEADVFRDLPIVRQDLLDYGTDQALQYLGVQKRCDIETFISKAMSNDKWNAMDLARYLITSAQEHVTRVMGMEIFPCNNNERRHIKELFASTETNRALKLHVINCDYWDSNTQEALFLIRHGLHEYPSIEELIPIASSEDDHAARRAAFAFLCGPLYEPHLERQFDPSKFSTFAFIPGVRDGKICQIPHGEVFSDPNWKVLGFGHLSDQFSKKNIAKLKIRDRPTAEKLFQVLQSTPPKDPQIAKSWFKFLAEKGGKQSHSPGVFFFSAGEFERIAELKIVPVEVSSEQPQSSKSYEPVAPRECFLKSESYSEDHFYQRLFKFVDFGPSANAFLKACGVKERPECIDVLRVLLKCPKTFLKLAGDDHERYLTELRLIAVGHKSLPRKIHEEMRTASIFLGYRQGKGGIGRDGYSHEADEFELCKAEGVLVADDMESRRTFGDCIFIAPQEELLEKFYSEMKVKSLSSCIKYTVEPGKELLDARSARDLLNSIIDKIPIFLHEFDEPRFRDGMRLLRWHDDNQFFVRACRKLDVTKRLDFPNATNGLQGQKAHPTELSAETQSKDGLHVLWIKEPKADSYDVAAALCRLLFSTYKKNDVLSLMTILDTDVNVLKRRGYDVDRILSEYRENLEKAEHGENPCNGAPPGPVQASPQDASSESESTCDKPESVSKFTKFLHRFRKDPRLGQIKLSEIENSIEKVKNIMKEEGGDNDSHISNREQVGGGKKQKNVAYCDEKKVAKTDLEECEGQHVGQVKVWKRKGTVLGVPSREREAFGNIISNLATVFSINQTRCHVFYHGEDSNLMGFNRNDQIFFGLEHYIQNHKDAPAGKAYIDWQVHKILSFSIY
ncbi:uncharacterized protein HD556DRAFT_1440065 [Suillus plorans]|uniref:Sacsin/Nov domain-containing protein n=1 Tax=Suillus plorans TaxID=116603 RepID=A0A9P7DNA2_9AGAM|nr:uncharacterized protein HD556DRAFT_1440065 [Suillus plorans]KAG1798994.1 hypothetical protein HD556DRAFT_1440065 [Suillus plorans]